MREITTGRKIYSDGSFSWRYYGTKYEDIDFIYRGRINLRYHRLFFYILQYFATFQWKESGEKSKTNRTTFDDKIDARFFDNYSIKEGRGVEETRKKQREIPVQNVHRDDETEQRTALFSIRSQSSRYAAA